MTTNEALIKKAARAQLLSSAGLKQSEIAKELGNVTTRTVRRYLSYELPDELTLPPSEVELAARVQFVERAWPLVLDLVNYVDSQLKAGELKGRDALVGLGILIDKIRQLQPPTPVVTETEQVTFVLRTREALPGGNAEGSSQALTEGDTG